MKKTFTLSSIIFICSALFAQQWTKQTSPVANNLYSVHAINANAVAIGSQNAMPHTLDGGNTWTNPLSMPTGQMFALHTANPTKWYTLDNNGNMVTQTNPSGTYFQNGKPTQIFSLWFTNSATAVAVGNAGKIVRTYDAAATWATITSPTPNNLRKVCFVNPAHGYVCGMVGTIITTLDSGSTWAIQNSGTTKNINSIHFPAIDTGFAVGATGTILKTTDGGITWLSIPPSPTYTVDLNDVWFINTQEGFAVGVNGIIIHSTDGANSWTVMNSGTTQTLNAIHFPNSTVGWAVGNGGTILKYDLNATSVNTISENAVSVSVYPNPFSDLAFIKINGAEINKLQLKMTDALGREVFPYVTRTSEGFVIDRQSLIAGIYFCELKNNSAIISIEKIIVQ